MTARQTGTKERDIRDLVNGDWKFSLATNVTLLTLRPHRRRTSTASTAAHRPSESKSKLKSSSKRITSSKYTLTTGSFPEQGAKQITDNRYAERTTQSVRELWENTTISTGHLLNNTKKPTHHTKSRWQRSTFPYFSNEVACSRKSGSPSHGSYLENFSCAEEWRTFLWFRFFVCFKFSGFCRLSWLYFTFSFVITKNVNLVSCFNVL